MMAFLSGYWDFWDNKLILIHRHELSANHTWYFASWENGFMYSQFVQFINYDVCTHKDKIISLFDYQADFHAGKSLPTLQC